jgi:DNA mismatch endonuclease (patch repair protein)
MALPAFNKPAENRSRNMRAIRSAGNKTTEGRLVSLLRNDRIHGWRRHPLNVRGRPDLLFQESRVAVFVDGCFWHGCPKCGHIPKTNRLYWKAKIARNLSRDAVTSRTLRAMGFRVVRLRECDLRERPEQCLRRLRRVLTIDRA